MIVAIQTYNFVPYFDYVTISKSNLIKTSYTHHKTSVGDVYFFEDYFVGEFFEGKDLNFDNFEEVTFLVKKYFPEKPFGFISNRINSYAINLGDASLFNETFPNLEAYAIVVYSSINEKIFEVENHFFIFNRKYFRNLEKAHTWVEETL